MSRVFLSPPELRPEDHEAVAAAMASNWIAPAGPELTRFEEALCARTGRSHAVALNSGTAALHLALQILGVGPGDTVVCPTLTFAASANPILYCGASPLFIDSEPRTWNLDPDLLKEALALRADAGRLPRAVIVVHLYGQCAEMNRIAAICERFGLPVIEDAAEALGARYQGRPAGSMGQLSFFSFNGNKIITTSGGGVLLADNPGWIQRARYLATQAREPVAHYEHREIGYNYRMSNVLAALGRSQLSDLERRIEQRRRHREAYRSALEPIPEIAFMPISGAGDPNYWLTCILVDEERGGVGRDVIIGALEAESIEARPLWKPLHLQPVFKDCPVVGGAVAEDLFRRGVCLPSGSALSGEDRERIIQVIAGCFSKSAGRTGGRS